MQTGRFIHKLVNDREQFYQTTGAEQILPEKSFEGLWNLSAEKPGEYQSKLIDEMAVANTIISIAYDSSGREIRENDTIIVKFDPSDMESILDTMIKCLNLIGSMKKIQHNGVELRNPLPEVKL